MAAAALWVVALVVTLVVVLWQRSAAARARAARVARCGREIVGPKPLPLFGNILDVGFDITKLYQKGIELHQKYGNLWRMWIGPLNLFVNIVDPRDIEALLSKSKNLNKAFNYEFLHPWLGLGLLTSTGERWKKHRKIITPTFHFTILEQFVDVFNKQGNVFLSILKEKEAKGPFDITPLVDFYTQDVICETAMGVELNSQTEGYSSSYLRSVKEMCKLLMVRSNRPWLYPEFIYRLSSYHKQEKENLEILHGYTKEVIRRRRELLEENPAKFGVIEDETGRKKKLAFLDLLLLSTRDGDVLSDEDLREEVDTFMFEGHDTTASGICFALMELSKRPDIQEYVYNELQEIMSNNKSKDMTLTLESLNKMKYLEQVIKETLRLYPSVPVYARQTTEDMELISKPVVIPPGVTIAIVPGIIHRSSEFYSTPLEFNPDHFAPETVLKRHPYAFIPFSAGPRNCIGQKFAMLEMKSILSKIIWNYSLEIEPSFQLVMIPEVTLKSLHGVKLSVTRRVHS